eukprot:CAMPEP_0114588022 /NCGR_PEP_ID=MMETSP0125-20121206/10834_1 /TAXON_ID=485358 ORGANISM="Aristerostoma sp., Strain ATCC 50986" /NCGR_SAMPLE_ID=MMETSP0125 /ASSEMBLY_ACC=CAM_ASM_000245 /LENGTH=345 /DNA_ID=CAMNT_0001784221 /DNA_START=71 /DNA_END=1108 /DNA_ORIENTATION=-
MFDQLYNLTNNSEFIDFENQQPFEELQQEIYEETEQSYNLEEYISIVLTYGNGMEKEFIPNIRVEVSPNDGSIDSKTLIDSLKREGFPIVNSQLFYQSFVDGNYIYIGDDVAALEGSRIYFNGISTQEGYQRSVTIHVQHQHSNAKSDSPSNCSNYNLVTDQLFNLEEGSTKVETLSFTPTITSPQPQSLSGLDEINQDNSTHEPYTNLFKKKTRVRHPERTIKEVVDLVNAWRALHDQSKVNKAKGGKKLSLGEAAKKLGVPKKSLDDYMLIMKHAKVLGFNFAKNLDKKFGVMRTFVKDNKDKADMVKQEPDFDFFDIKEECITDNSPVKIDLCFTSKKINKY